MPDTSFLRPEEFLRQLGVHGGSTFVHLGSGPGFYAIPAAIIVGLKGKVVAVDILPDLLAETEARAKQKGVDTIIRTIRADLEGPQGSTLPAAYADWVLISNILHQTDPKRIMAEAVRVSKGTGTIIVVEWDTAASPFGPPAATRIPKNRVLALSRELSLHAAGELKPSPYHYGFLFKKTA